MPIAREFNPQLVLVSRLQLQKLILIYTTPDRLLLLSVLGFEPQGLGRIRCCGGRSSGWYVRVTKRICSDD
jgi:hypothetical protein